MAELADKFDGGFVISMDGLRPTRTLAAQCSNGAGPAGGIQLPGLAPDSIELLPALLEPDLQNIVAGIASHGADA